jgi:predicted GNAT family acetyltransferase
MNVQQYATAAEILPHVQAFLEREAVVANLPLGLLTRMSADPPVVDEGQEPFFLLAAHEGEPVLLMMRTPPHNMILHASAADVEQCARLQDAYRAGIAFLLREGLPVPGVIGPRDVATGFADAWVAQAGGSWQVQMEQMIYRLDEVADLPASPGKLIQATEAHLDLMVDWMIAFSEVVPEGALTREEARERAERHIAEQTLYLWHDEQPVSKAWRARPAGQGITVTGVYTPPRFRRKGYATACVAALSRLLLAEGYRYCTLYTDLANPTSNSIYQKIGYRPVRASAMVEFAP